LNRKTNLTRRKSFACKIPGIRYKTTTKFNWLKANIEMALRHKDFSQDMLRYLQHLDREEIMLQGKIQMLEHSKKKEVYI